MSKAKHTQGPWSYDPAEFSIRGGVIRDGEGGIVADNVRLEDAGLIAEAPALLQFAKQEFERTNCTCKFLGYLDEEPPCNRCKLGTLVAKAEGRE